MISKIKFAVRFGHRKSSFIDIRNVINDDDEGRSLIGMTFNQIS